MNPAQGNEEFGTRIAELKNAICRQMLPRFDSIIDSIIFFSSDDR